MKAKNLTIELCKKNQEQKQHIDEKNIKFWENKNWVEEQHKLKKKKIL